MRISSLLAAGLVCLAITGTAQAAPERKRAGYDRTQPTSRADMIASVNQRFDKIDANKDGMIDAAEMAAHRETMKERRAERMAALEARATDEQKARWGERMANRKGGWAGKGTGERGNWFSRLDTNDDGLISREEFAVSAMKRFDRADADGDGIVTAEERAAARDARKARS
jgi:hypothetical protein